MRKLKNGFAFLGLIFLGMLLMNAIQQDKAITPETKKNTTKTENDYNVYALDVPETLHFAGEKVPLHLPDIKERMDRELLVNTYWQSNGLLLFKRANKYFPIIEPILKEYGIPDDFKYLAVIESGLQNVTSPAGARGFCRVFERVQPAFVLAVDVLIKHVDECQRGSFHFGESAHFGHITEACRELCVANVEQHDRNLLVVSSRHALELVDAASPRQPVAMRSVTERSV